MTESSPRDKQEEKQKDKHKDKHKDTSLGDLTQYISLHTASTLDALHYETKTMTESSPRDKQKEKQEDRQN